MAIAVRYSDVEDFLDELRERAGEVQGGIVRTSCSMEFERPSTRYYLTAGAVVGNMLVELRAKCGTATEDREHTLAKSIYLTAKDRIEREASALGLKVRAGFFVEVCGNGGWR